MSDASAKWAKIHHGALLENSKDPDSDGKAAGIDRWRCAVWLYCADQASAERMAKTLPAITDPSRIGEVRNAIKALKERSRLVQSAMKLLYFPNLLGCSDQCHMYWNAFQHHVEAIPTWPRHKKQLQALVHILGHRMRVEWFVRHMMARATQGEKDVLLYFHHNVVDWRWERLEFTELALTVAFPIFCDYYVDAICKDIPDADYLDALRDAVENTDFFNRHNECIALGGHAVGREIRELLGCPCHGDLLMSIDSYAKRCKAFGVVVVCGSVCVVCVSLPT